jgi:hypothetical protein
MRQRACYERRAHGDRYGGRCAKSRRVATNGASGRLALCQGGATMRAEHAATSAPGTRVDGGAGTRTTDRLGARRPRPCGI